MKKGRLRDGKKEDRPLSSQPSPTDGRIPGVLRSPGSAGSAGPGKMRGRPASGPDGRQILRELFLLLHATKSRLENESFYGALSNDDQGRALDLLDEMAPQLMELETNKDPALLAQIQAFHGRLRPAIQRLRKNGAFAAFPSRAVPSSAVPSWADLLVTS